MRTEDMDDSRFSAVSESATYSVTESYIISIDGSVSEAIVTMTDKDPTRRMAL